MATMTDKKNGWQKIGGNELRCILRKLSPAFAGRDCDAPSGRNIKVKDGTATLSGRGFTASTETTLQGEFFIPYEPRCLVSRLSVEAKTLLRFFRRRSEAVKFAIRNGDGS